MSIDLNDPKMAGYIPLDEIVEDDGGVSGGKVAEEVQLSVATLTFPNTGETYESSSQAIVITNTGYDQVTIYGVSVEGEFALKSSVPGSLLPGESASVNVSFKPTSVGAKTGSVYFDTGNAAGDEYVTLTGTGIISAPEVPPDELHDLIVQVASDTATAIGATKQDHSTNLDTFATMTVVDEDDMASDSDQAIPTQQSIKAYVDGFKTLFTNFALTLVAVATYAEAWLVLKLNGSLPTRTLIKAITPQVGMSILLTEAGRVGNFIWRAGDYSAQIAMDTAEGMFLKADSVAANLGAWVREFEILNVEHFGASAGGDPAVNQAAIQCAFNVAQDYVGGLMIRDAYTVSGPIVQTKALQVWGYHSDRSKIITTVGPALSLVPTAGISSDNTWWGWKNVAFITSADGHHGIEYVSSGNEYMSNWTMEGVKASGPAGGVSFDSTGSTVGIFSCTMRRNWWDNGSSFLSIGDSVHILENTINGNNIGIFVNGVKGGAQQLVIADNNITTRSECVYLLNVPAAHIDRNWMETPSYLGSYTGGSGSLCYLQGCSNSLISRNTIQPLLADMIARGQTAAAYSIFLNGPTHVGTIIEKQRLIAVGTTGHVRISGNVNDTYIKEDNKFDVTNPVITNDGINTFGVGNTPGVFHQLVKFTTSAAFGTVVTFESTDAGAGNGPFIDAYRNSASPAASDGQALFQWTFNNSNGVKTVGAYIGATLLNPTAGSEDYQLNFVRKVAGADVTAFSIGATITFNAQVEFISPFGYKAGAGGTVVQATSKATAVVLNKATGKITTAADALAANTGVTFTLTNSLIAATDTLTLNHAGGGTFGAYVLNARCAAGSATINIRNVTGGSLSEALDLRFTVVKGSDT